MHLSGRKSPPSTGTYAVLLLAYSPFVEVERRVSARADVVLSPRYFSDASIYRLQHGATTSASRCRNPPGGNIKEIRIAVTEVNDGIFRHK